MRIILKHVLRNIKEKKGRSLLIIFSLIIATTVLVINLTLPDELIIKLEETLRSMYGNADVSISQEESFSIEDINMDDEKITYTGTSTAQVMAEKKISAIIGINIKDGKDMKLIPNEIPNLKENEVVINKKQAEKFGYKENQEIDAISINEETFKLKIVKIVDSKGILSLDLDDPVFLANIDTVNRIEKVEDNKYQMYYIDVENNDNVNKFGKYLTKNNKDFTTEVLVSMENVREQTAFISYIMLIIFAISIVMIFFVVGALNKVIIAERIPVIGTFRSIGATKQKMNFILVIENAVYGLIGGIIGCALGYAVKSAVALKFFVTTDGIEVSEQTSKLGIGTIIVSILFAVLLEIFISIRTIIRTNKKPIKDIIFNVSSTRYRIRKFNIIIGALMFVSAFIVNACNQNSNIALVLLSIILALAGIANLVPIIIRAFSEILSIIFKKISWGTGIIASRNMGYNKMIISSSRLIVVSISAILTILTVSASASKAFESFKYVCNFDILVGNLSKNSEEYESLKELKEINSVEYMYYFYDEGATYNNKKFNAVPIIIAGSKNRTDIKEFDYKISDLKYDEMLVDEKYAEKNHIKINDKIKLELPSKNKTIEYKVVGLVNSVYFTTSRNVVVINLNNYRENITDIPTRLEITTKDGINEDKIKALLKEQIKEVGLDIVTVKEYVEEQEQQIAGVMGIFYVIVGITVMLAFIGIINNQVISFMQRKREIAVLNSTCMSKWQIIKMLSVETILSNIISCSIALIVGCLMAGILRNALISMSMYIELLFDWKVAFKFVGIVFAILLITLIKPFKQLRKIKLIDEIKYE